MTRSRTVQLLAVVVLAGLATLASLGRPAPAVAQGAAPPDLAPHGWQYKFVRGYSEQEFNAVGKEGWELAEYVGPNNANTGFTFVFKRPILREGR